MEFKDLKILFKLPTRERPEKCFKILCKFYEYIINNNVIFLLSLDEDDPKLEDYKKFLSTFKNLTYYVGKSKSKIHAINRDVEKVQGIDWNILSIICDDTEPCFRGFDEMIREDMFKSFPDTDGVLWYYDGFIKNINTHPIIGRKYYERFNYIVHPAYNCYGPDLELTEVADMLGKQAKFEKQFLSHQHSAYIKSIPKDALFLRNHAHRKDDAKILAYRKSINYEIEKISSKISK